MQCPECTDIFPSIDALRLHFRNTSDKEHVLTLKMDFMINATKRKKGSITLYRQDDLSFICPCNSAKYQNRASAEKHIMGDGEMLGLTGESGQAHNNSAFKQTKPAWHR